MTIDDSTRVVRAKRHQTKWGVRGRLLLAFISVSMFSVVAAATGVYSLSQIGKSMDQITERRVPEALAWQEVSRNIEKVVQAAPALLAVDTFEKQKTASTDVFKQMDELEKLLEVARRYSDLDASTNLQVGAIDVRSAADRAVTLLGQINNNFVEIDRLVVKRLNLADEKQKVQKKIRQSISKAQRTLSPNIRVLNTQISEWNNSNGSDESRELSPKQADLARGIIATMPQQRAASLFDQFNREALKVAGAESIEAVALASFPLTKNRFDLNRVVADLRPRIQRRLQKEVKNLGQLTLGSGGLSEVRKAELEIVEQAEELLDHNRNLSSFLINRAGTLVAAANQRIDESNLEAVQSRTLNGQILLGVVLMSLISSLLIVWLYVSRNLTARISSLSSSMLAIAGGDLNTPLPKSRGTDEITQMAKALVGFRDTAVEVKESNLREITAARQRLVDAIESINEGFAFYDADDCLVMSNQRYKDLLYSGAEVDLTPGTSFENILRNSIGKNMIEEAQNDPEEWLQNRLDQHRNPGQPLLQKRSGDRWILVSERIVTGGGSVAIYSDLTELKKREDQLSHANQQIMSSVHYASRIQEAMLPSRKALAAVLPDHFLIWEPRDIVGGDFFWCHNTEHGAYIIVGDCTGHGVPGAFMTLIACGLIDRHLRTTDQMKPSELLSAMHKDLQELLGQNEKNSETDDGLEAGVCFIDFKEQMLTFAGSRFSLFVAGDDVEEIKGDKIGIGYHRYDRDAEFTDNLINIDVGSRYIMASDGLFDQVGGPKRRGFGKRRLLEFIKNQRTNDIQKQGDALRETLAEFQGIEYRRDDLTVLGFQVPPN